MHYADPDGGQNWAPSNVAFASDWHTATTEWLPGSVKYYLDSTLVGSFTTEVSCYPMHWVLAVGVSIRFATHRLRPHQDRLGRDLQPA